jgi:hypothetical protein
MANKVINFADEGVTITIPRQLSGMNIHVEKKELESPAQYPSRPNFQRIKLVINIGFFVIDASTGQKRYINNLNPPAKLRIRYGQNVKERAGGKKKKLARWDITTQSWVDLKSRNTSSPSGRWKGYGDVETPGWDDPPIAWGT